MTDRHKVFISCQEDDARYRNRFTQMMEGHIVNRSVGDGDIGVGLKVETICQKIRDKFIADATVTVVLIGKCTWQRKHIDWEIRSSLRKTAYNPRCGLLGILLPTHPNYNTGKYNPKLIPPRLADNLDNKYASIYNWIEQPQTIQEYIHDAYRKRDNNPDLSRISFSNNRSGKCSNGWVS